MKSEERIRFETDEKIRLEAARETLWLDAQIKVYEKQIEKLKIKRENMQLERENNLELLELHKMTQETLKLQEAILNHPLYQDFIKTSGVMNKEMSKIVAEKIIKSVKEQENKSYIG